LYYVTMSIEEHSGSLTTYEMKKLNKWINADERSESIINTKEDIKMVLYDYREMPMDYHKSVKKMKKDKNK